MGSEVVLALRQADDMECAAAVDPAHAGVQIGGVTVESSLTQALDREKPQVLVDFTIPSAAMQNIREALTRKVAVVVGTTGLTQQDLEEISLLCSQQGTGALVASNFAVGAVLMMEFAAQAARFLPDVEIIELHHEKKLDSPSGTAISTARKIAAARRGSPRPQPAGTVEKIPGGRGAEMEGIHIHSVRLPGHVAHQQVVFGGLGETLTIRHDSLDRKGFMPGVLLGVRAAAGASGLIVGLENVLFAE
jgi:4-hydroxy-tetrahydrodipicolinate reductase